MAEKINPEMVRPFKTSKSRSARSKKVVLPGPSLSELPIENNSVGAPQ